VVRRELLYPGSLTLFCRRKERREERGERREEGGERREERGERERERKARFLE
jgi:hypothetical protein